MTQISGLRGVSQRVRLMPEVKIIAPWRELGSAVARRGLLRYAEKPASGGLSRKGKAARPTRWTPTCCTSPMKAGAGRPGLFEPEESMCAHHLRRRRRRQRPEYVELEYRRGDIVRVNGRSCRRRRSSPGSTGSAAATASGASTWLRTATSA